MAIQELREGLAARLRVPAGQNDVFIFDTKLRGFFLRKFKSDQGPSAGRASYGVKYACNGQQRRLRLGAALPGELAKMRAEATRILNEARAGRDVVAERRAAKTKTVTTLGALVPTFLAHAESKLRPRSHVEVARYLMKAWAPLHGMSVTEIARQDVVRILDDIAASQGEVTADRAKSALGSFYKWSADRYDTVSPVLRVGRYKKNGSRERTLSEAELREVWRACGDDDYGRIVKLLLLTGQRREEIGGLLWTEVDTAKREIALPGARTKNSRPHSVPLSDQAMALLPERRTDESEFVFSYSRFSGGFSSWPRAKVELDARITAARASAGNSTPMPPWVLHDLRRTFVTLALEHRLTLPHIIEACVNHLSGHKGSVAGTYNRASYAAEKREALERWGAHVAALVGTPHRAVEDSGECLVSDAVERAREAFEAEGQPPDEAGCHYAELPLGTVWVFFFNLDTNQHLASYKVTAAGNVIRPTTRKDHETGERLFKNLQAKHVAQVVR